MSQGTVISPFDIDQACDFQSLVYTCKNPDGTLFDLTDFDALMRFRTSPQGIGPSAGAILLSLTSINGVPGGIYLGGATATIQFVLTGAQAKALPTGGCYADMVCTNRITGFEFKALRGQPFVYPTAAQ